MSRHVTDAAILSNLNTLILIESNVACMSTSSSKNKIERTVGGRFGVHHRRGAVAVVAAAGYAMAVSVSGSPVALLAGLFVPLSLAAESAFRAARSGPLDRRGEALATGLGVLTGAVTTATVVFAAGVVGL